MTTDLLRRLAAHVAATRDAPTPADILVAEALEAMRREYARGYHVAMDAAVRAALSRRYGSPSSRRGRNPPGWHLDRDCTPTDAAMHDNGCIDSARAIRALPSPPERDDG